MNPVPGEWSLMISYNYKYALYDRLREASDLSYLFNLLFL
jgi:hypothetical protein